MASNATLSRRLGGRILIVLAGCLLAGAAAAQSGSTTPSSAALQAQRAAFKQAYAAAQQGGTAWQALAANLHTYPLYPYLPAAAMEHDIRQLDVASVQAYLQQYPQQIPAADLRRDFLLELARRQDWTDFLALAQPGLGSALACDALQAKLAQGGTLDFDRDLADLWMQPSLPSACDPVLQAAHAQGLLTGARVWSRIDRAADAGKPATISQLAVWLASDDDVQAAQRLALALNDPAAAVRAAANWPDNARSRQAAALALQKLARRQSNTADTAWQALQQRFQFSTEQRDNVLNALALFHATDFDANALARLIALPAAAQSAATREWRVRVALSQQDWHAVLAAIDAMPAEQQQDDEWRYFRARATLASGQSAAAQAMYATLARQPNYFGFLAADHLDTPYSLCPLILANDAQREQSLLADPGMQRAFEWFALDQPKLARREWTQALVNADPATLQSAVALAYERGWYDRAVFTLNSGSALRFYQPRFPLASQDGVVPQATQAGIDPTWAYGILRAESAWMTDARSGADARGLMQLLPGTAQQVARSSGLPWNGGDSLYDPAVNIALGTRYLAQLATRFDGAPWLASAAYNAGPYRVDQWIDARGTLPPDLFVATIPFKETREYVARVLTFSVIYDWRLHGNANTLSRRMPAIGQPYIPPDAHTPRKDVVCAVSETPPPQNASPSALPTSAMPPPSKSSPP